jgi:hypothetical protein
MYFDYVKERESLDNLVIDDGFALYRKDCDTLFIRDIYTKNRNSTTFFKLFKQLENIAKDLSCKCMEGHVYTTANNPTLSLRAILSAGFKVVHADLNRIILVKEI